MRHGQLTTEQAIEILAKGENCIYWTEDAYDGPDTVDWLMVSIFFNTQEIHTFGQLMMTKIYLPYFSDHPL